MMNQSNENQPAGGILLVDKPKGISSFRLVQILRKRLGIRKIGHAGTLDPFATGLMVMLVGRDFTKLSNSFLCANKEYIAELFLGSATDTFDHTGTVKEQSSYVPALAEIESALLQFQGEVEQMPPMYSAKKINGKKLYELARKGIEIPREPVKITLETLLIRYEYPLLELRIVCSKGSYMRTLADDLGRLLGCFAHLTQLKRTRSGDFYLKDSISEADLTSPSIHLPDKYYAGY